MGHNEDNAALFKDLGYILEARYTDPASPGKAGEARYTDPATPGKAGEVITFYCYPGMLCGNAFGFNDKGVVMTQDALSPSNVNISDESIGT